MLKYLRIPVTALSLTACVLLIALWVRSFTTTDILFGRLSSQRAFTVHSVEGAIVLLVNEANGGQWRTRSYEHGDKMQFRKSRWRAGTTPAGWHISGPHWFLVLLAAIFAVAPWMGSGWQFSLRTLLIATTLVAVVLGIVMSLN